MARRSVKRARRYREWERSTLLSRHDDRDRADKLMRRYLSERGFGVQFFQMGWSNVE